MEVLYTAPVGDTGHPPLNIGDPATQTGNVGGILLDLVTNSGQLRDIDHIIISRTGCHTGDLAIPLCRAHPHLAHRRLGSRQSVRTVVALSTDRGDRRRP
ncbi:hypothetical protein YPPY36_0562 [Yersinia pestis PY-36]|nr:hypothetical protein YPPY36_0562 [Yersinia pestis PY-36]